MKAVLFSIGTRGDIEPFLAIAQILKEKEWEVICVFPEQFREVVEHLGFSFRGFPTVFLETFKGKDASLLMGGHGSSLYRLMTLFKLIIKGINLSKDIIAVQHKTQMEENPDRVLYHPQCIFSLIWGMKNPGKSIMISPIPVFSHPLDHLSIIGRNHGRLLNRLGYWLVNMMKAILIKKVYKKYQQDYDNFPLSIPFIKKTMEEREKTIYSVSPSLFSKPLYWPPSAFVGGYFERNQKKNWQPSQALLQFLEKYERCVFISFGSISSLHPKETTRTIINVLERNRIAAIINVCWGALEKIECHPASILFTEEIPYDWIFPKMYAVIHHGGAGTTHTALKYGCPALIIPHILDQFYWEETIVKLSLGPPGIPIKKLNERNFEKKLLDLVNNTTYKLNALAISEKMKLESNPEWLYEIISGNPIELNPQ